MRKRKLKKKGGGPGPPSSGASCYDLHVYINSSCVSKRMKNMYMYIKALCNFVLFI